MAMNGTSQMYYCGNWKACRDYESGNVVKYDGLLWMAIAQNAGIAPEDDEGAGYWMPLGETGGEYEIAHNELEEIQGGDAESGEFFHATKKQSEAMTQANTPSGDNPFLTAADMPALEKRVADFRLMEKPEGVGTLYAAAFGDGVFAAVGDDSAVTSPDGKDWTRREIPRGYWRGVAHGGDVFAAVGLNGKAMYSEDGGETWTEAAAPEGDWNALTFGNGMFIGVCDGQIARSLDGKTGWTAKSVPAGHGEAVCFGNGVFTAMGPAGAMTSTDGLNWTERETPSATWRCCAYGKDKFVALAGKCAYSEDDGQTWQSSGLPSGGWDAVIHGGGFFVGVGNSAQRIVTRDGELAWEQSATPNFVWRGLAFGLDTFVAVGGGIMAAKIVDAAAALANANAPSGANPFATAEDLQAEREALEEAKEEISTRHATDMETLREKIGTLTQALEEAKGRITALESGAVIEGEA